MKNITKKLISLMSVFALCLSLFSCGLVNPPDEDPGKKPPENPPVQASEATTLVTVSINPKIEITLDENGLVATVYGANEDGQVLLYSEENNILGKNYEEAIAYITDLAIEYGYLDAETGTVNTSVIGENEEIVNTIKEKINAKISNTASLAGIDVSAISEDPMSLLLELEELKAKYENNPEIQALTIEKYKLAVTASEREGIEITAAVKLSDEELIAKISEAHGKLEKYATDAYLQAKAQATKLFDEAMGVLLDGVYNEVYLANILKHLDTFYFGAMYQAYKTSARTYKSVADIVSFRNDMADFEVDETVANAIAEELMLEDTTPLENDEGKVTVESLIAFCDEYLANNDVSAEVQVTIKGYVIDAKNAAMLATKGLSEMYNADMAALKVAIEGVITAVTTASQPAKLFMNDEQKAEFEACLADLNGVVANVEGIMNGDYTVEEIEAFAIEASLKAEEILTKIKEDLSEDELASVDAKIAAIEETKARLVSEFESRLASAETQAKEFIESERARRAQVDAAE